MRGGGWKWATVGDVGQYINGMAFKPTDWGNEGRPIIRIQNLTDLSRPFNFTTRSVEQKFKVQDGDILVSWSATLDAFIWRGPEAVLNQHIFKVIPNRNVVSDAFLFYQLKHVIEEMWRGEHTHGSTMMHINRGPFLAHPFWIAPLPEQHLIVAAIETHFSRVDAAVAALTRAKANVKRARASVLKAAVEGRLVPTEAALARAEGRAYETGAALLVRILDERRAAWAASGGRGKYKEPVGVGGDGGVGEVPEGWVWASCEQLLRELQTGPFGSSLHASEYVSGGTPVVNPQHIRGEHIVPMSTVAVDETVAVRLRAFKLHEGDIVLGRRGEMGRCAVVRRSEAGWILGTGSLALRLVPDLNRTFFAWVLRSPATVRYLEGESVGTTMTNLNQKILLDLPIPLPPLAEQRRIVAEVDRRLSVLDALDRSLDANLARCGRLRQAILKRAFEGRLVVAGASGGGVGVAEEAGV